MMEAGFRLLLLAPAWVWTASLLVVAAVGVTGWMVRSSAATRHLVWALALAGVATLPMLTRAMPTVGLPILPAVESAAALPASGRADADPASTVAAPTEPPLTPMSSESERVQSSAASRRVERHWLVQIWALGVALVLARMLAGLLEVRRLARRSSVVTDREWIRLAELLRLRLGIERRVALLQGDDASVPVTWGVRRPVIWLPAAAEGWSTERREAVLAHELGHVKRLDGVTQSVALLAVALHWFNPLVWLAARSQRRESERACDDLVLETGIRPSEYAGHLLDIVHSSAWRGPPAAAFALARRSQLEVRLLAILDAQAARARVSGPMRVGSVAAAILLVACAASVRAVPASASYQPQTVSAAALAPVSDRGSDPLPDPALEPEPPPAHSAVLSDASPYIDVRPRAEPALTGPPWSTVLRLDASENGAPSWRLRIEAEGVLLSPEKDAVVGLADGGSLVIMHDILPGYGQSDPLRPAGSSETLVRTLRVSAGPDGDLRFAYTVNADPRSFDANGRIWLARILRENHHR